MSTLHIAKCLHTLTCDVGGGGGRVLSNSRRISLRSRVASIGDTGTVNTCLLCTAAVVAGAVCDAGIDVRVVRCIASCCAASAAACMQHDN